MADTNAIRSQRARRHKQGDHSMCRRNCQAARPSLKIAEVPAGSGENLDPSAALRELAVQLLAAYAKDPANAALAREARSTLLVLAPDKPDGVEAEWGRFVAELSQPVAADDDDG